MSEEKYVELLEDGELYDYITNIEQENKELKDINNQLTNSLNKKVEEGINVNNQLSKSEQTRLKAVDKLDDLFDKPICKVLSENDSGWGDIAMYEESKVLFDIKQELLSILDIGKDTDVLSKEENV